LELLEVNDCFSLPCLNSGTCIPLSQGNIFKGTVLVISSEPTFKEGSS